MTDVARPGFRTAESADGTRLAYEQFGAGRPLITVHGASAHRALMRPTAEAFGQHFQAVTYDRRGRFDSGDTLPYAVEREIEDIAALIAEVGGGPVHLYGHSSGAGLVLHAVAAGLPVDQFVLHDPPYSPDDEPSRDGARRYGRTIRSLLAQERRADALETFCRLTGMPEEVIDGMRGTHRWAELTALALAATVVALVVGVVLAFTTLLQATVLADDMRAYARESAPKVVSYVNGVRDEIQQRRREEGQSPEEVNDVPPPAELAEVEESFGPPAPRDLGRSLANFVLRAVLLGTVGGLVGLLRGRSKTGPDGASGPG